MIYLYSLLLGVIQGITELLPISSSGHLVILHEFIDLKLTNNLAFDVSLHLGSALAMIIFLWPEFKLILGNFFKNLLSGRMFQEKEQNMIWYLIIATIPAVIIGYFFGDLIEWHLRFGLVVVVTLIIGAILFLLAEKFTKRSLDLWQMNWWKALLIGILQATALIPGVSRSGITIITGMSLKLKRTAAAKFSFLIAVPAVLGAGVKEGVTLIHRELNNQERIIFVIGFIASLFFSYLAIKWLLKFLQNHKLHVFAYYRIALAVVILIIVIITR